MHPEYRFRRLRFWAVGLVAIGAMATAPSTAVADWGRAPQVVIALLPNGTSPRAFDSLPRIAPGLLNAGIGDVPDEQTYLDIGQGNRVEEHLYDAPLPPSDPHGTRAPRWAAIVARADAPPADLIPGLLVSTLRAARLPTVADGQLREAALLAAARNGGILRSNVGASLARCPAAVCVLDVKPADLGPLLASLRGADLLIALERPPPRPDHQLTIGIAGRGFRGNLTSDSTRLRGYVLSTDIAPTILERLGAPVPSQMSGEPIRSEGGRDVAAVVSLEDRLTTIIDRRGPVIGASALVWIALAGLVALLSRGALARPAVRMLALSGAYLPALLLIGAAAQPSLGVERLIVLLGAPLLAAATLALLPGYRALAAACAVTTLAFAVDVIAGSPLTPLSLIGPDPGRGIRFYGIGNELEATLTPLVLVGTGAALAGLWPRLAARRCAAVFFAVALAFAFVFAFGRFGADVGAAIVLPAGGAAAVAALGAARRSVALVIAAPLAALAVLALLDLLLGGNAHLTRSVLDAGGLHDLGDVAERRLRLSANSFSRGLDSLLLWIAVIAVALGVWQRQRVLSWFAGAPALRAGFLGAALAMLVATLANDSGALLLEVGTLYLALFAGFAWSYAGVVPGEGETSNADARRKRHA
jgi:hypothetical protein